MKRNTTSRLFFLFTASFIMSLLLGAVVSFLSVAASSVFTTVLYYSFSHRLAYYMNRMFRPGVIFAFACVMMSIGQFYFTYFLDRVLKDKVMAFAAMCVASFFCSNAFLRYTDSSFFVMYPMRWLPCEICAFIAGIAAILASGPILPDEKENMPEPEKSGMETADSNISPAPQPSIDEVK